MSIYTSYASKKSKRSQQKVQTSGERLISWNQEVDINSLEYSELQQQRSHEAFLEWVGGKQAVTPLPDDFVVAFRQGPEREPENLSVVERKLYEVNPADREWLSGYFADLPYYLTKYFANKYVSIFKKNGRFAANTFIREKMVPAHTRVLLVLEQYKRLPTTSKVALMSDALDDEICTHQSHVEQSNWQLSFDFEQAEKNRKPVRYKIIAELTEAELREMAFKIMSILIRYQTLLTRTIECETKNGENIAALMVYKQCVSLVRSFGVKTPSDGKKITPEKIMSFISKLSCEKWWLKRLKHIRKIMREHLAIAMGQVSVKASPYASWDCLQEHKAQQKRNWDFIQANLLQDETTGEEVEMADMVLKSVSNPAIRRHELMARCRGCEDIGNALGLQGLFLTLTTPSKYHNSYKKGGFIPHWNGASPREAQAYLNKVWQCIRAKLGRDEIPVFGIRVAEPHHDGTPHWHLLIWVKSEQVAKVREVFIRYAVKEDKEELYPFFERNEKTAAKKLSIQGPFNYQPRCDFGYIDPERGTATGYIAKYISKNIDGYAMGDEFADETVTVDSETGKNEGQKAKDMAKNVSAWKSRWNIRQFQFFGGAPVTTYRELRRFANQNKKAFMEYLFMQQRVDLLTIYSMLQRDLVGPIKPSKLITNAELITVIGDAYQARGDLKQSRVAGILAAADHGNWQGYIMGQGGPFVKREDLLIVNAYQVLPFASPHGEDVRKIEGFTTPEETVKTRTKVWTIIKKSEVNEEAEACTQGSAATAIGASGSSWSSVNNCTPSQKVQVSEQLRRLLEPYSAVGGGPPNIDDSALVALLNGSSIRIDDEKSLRIRPAERLPCGKVRPAQLVEEYQPKPDLSWLEQFEVKISEDLTGEDEDYEYQQPNLSEITVSQRQNKSWADYLEIIESDDWPLV
ncbi:replication endonuclease [Vibrio crassostreae]|uniref:replication endonuclease n=1 Tax=Vibrio crassostreae TaxID=246167 RepID=UPI001FEE044D|nr:replication endonuclease [Vibrio crassostreae]